MAEGHTGYSLPDEVASVFTEGGFPDDRQQTWAVSSPHLQKLLTRSPAKGFPTASTARNLYKYTWSPNLQNLCTGAGKILEQQGVTFIEHPTGARCRAGCFAEVIPFNVTRLMAGLTIFYK